MKPNHDVQKSAEEKKKGFHCLSAWDGSHREFNLAIKQQLKNPSSFEHVSTKVTPVSDKGVHTILMEYRATNSFGGVVPGTALGTFNNSDCKFNILTVE